MCYNVVSTSKRERELHYQKLKRSKILSGKNVLKFNSDYLHSWDFKKHLVK